MTRPERLVMAVVLVTLSAMAAGIVLVFSVSRWQEGRVTAAAAPPTPPTVADLVAVLKGDRSRDIGRAQAAELLAKRGAAAVPELKACLQEESASVRRVAVLSLKRIGNGAREVLPDLLTLLQQDPDAETRGNVAAALPEIAADDPRAWEGLVKALDDPNSATQKAALEALAVMQPPQIASLAAALDHPNLEVALYATEVLGRLGAAAVPAVPALADKLGDRTHLGSRCGNSLHTIGLPAVGEMVRIARDETRDITFVSLTFIIARLDPAAAAQFLPRLIDALKSSQVPLRQRRDTIRFTLHYIGAASVAPLVKLLDDPDRETRITAALALAMVAPRNEASIPGLIEGLADDDVHTRVHAIHGLWPFRSKAMAAVPRLRQMMLADPDGSVRRYAEQALKDIDPAGSLPMP